MKQLEFKKEWLTDVKILINNREECYKFQEIAFEFGVRVHSEMNEEKQTPIAYNISDVLPEYKNRTFERDMTNLVIYDNGTRLQQSSFYGLEAKKEISFLDFIDAYESIQWEDDILAIGKEIEKEFKAKLAQLLSDYSATLEISDDGKMHVYLLEINSGISIRQPALDIVLHKSFGEYQENF